MDERTVGLIAVIFLLITGLSVNGCRGEKFETKNKVGSKYKNSKISDSKLETVKAESISPEESSPQYKNNENTLLIADFNSCKKPNKLGGNFGAWDKDPKDFTQSAMNSFISNVKYGKEGCSVQIAYDVISPNVAYNGFWMSLNGLDASEYNNFNFWVKGDSRRGFTRVFKVELKNSKGEVGKTYVTGLDDKWQKITLPLSKFKNLTDFTTLKEFVSVFEDRIATAKEGAIYIDNIYLSK